MKKKGHQLHDKFASFPRNKTHWFEPDIKKKQRESPYESQNESHFENQTSFAFAPTVRLISL